MPAAIPIAIAVMAASTVYSGVESNQQAQHAKGAAEAEKTAMDGQIADAKKMGEADKVAKANTGGASQGAAIAALKASMSSGGSMGGSILSGGAGAAAAPTASKTLLGA